jgi:hypothetical protein
MGSDTTGDAICTKAGDIIPVKLLLHLTSKSIAAHFNSLVVYQQ